MLVHNDASVQNSLLHQCLIKCFEFFNLIDESELASHQSFVVEEQLLAAVLHLQKFFTLVGHVN